MKKNSGFTIIEVIVAFALTMVIVLFLFQLVITLKQAYTTNTTSSELILKQSNISQMINNDLLTYNDSGVNLSITPTEGDFIVYGCYRINVKDSSNVTLITQKYLCYDQINNTITYNDYEFKLDKESRIGTIDVHVTDNILYISIPISYPDLNDNFGIKAVIRP